MTTATQNKANTKKMEEFVLKATAATGKAYRFTKEYTVKACKWAKKVIKPATYIMQGGFSYIKKSVRDHWKQFTLAGITVIAAGAVTHGLIASITVGALGYSALTSGYRFYKTRGEDIKMEKRVGIGLIDVCEGAVYGLFACIAVYLLAIAGAYLMPGSIIGILTCLTLILG